MERTKGTKRKAVTKLEAVHSNLLYRTGCSLLDFALSDHYEGGFQLGKIANIIGDSHSGKTALALSCYAEMAKDERFRKYRFIYDDAEEACEFNMAKMFGQDTEDRIEPPGGYGDEDRPIMSSTIQDFHVNLIDALDGKKPFLYILDSLDALNAEEDIEKMEDFIKAKKEGKKTKGTYGMAKAKRMSWILRDIVDRLKETKSGLLIISQTRADINPRSFKTRTRAGGEALRFYCTHELWLAHLRNRKKKKIQIGADTRTKVSKNKLTGKVRVVDYPIYDHYGVDDIGATIDWLVANGYWKQTRNTIDARPFGKGTREKLIKEIEKKNKEEALRKHAFKWWREFEDSLKLGRKAKYS